MRSVLIPLLCAGLAGAPLEAQELVITKSTQVSFGGAMDFIMRLAGSGGPQTQRLSISVPASTFRSDDFDGSTPTTSTITNLSSGAMVVIDHEDRSYFTYNFGDLLAGGPFAAGMMQPPADSVAPEPAESDGAQYEIDIRVDRRDGRQRVLDWDTEATLLTVTATPTRAPEGMSVDSMPVYVMLTELWMADDFPANEAMEEMSEEIAGALQGVTGLDPEAMSQAFAQNLQFAEAFQENQEELAKLDGMPLKQISSFVALSPGAEVNADSALYGSMGEMRLDVGGAIASAVTSGITGRLGRFGRRRDPEPEPEPEPAGPAPTQILMFRSIEEVTGFEEGLAAGWDAVPADYQEKPNPIQPRP